MLDRWITMQCFQSLASHQTSGDPPKLNALQWRHNERNGVSNHQPHDCLFNRLFRHKSKKTSKLPVTGLCEGNSLHKGPVTRTVFQFDDVIMALEHRGANTRAIDPHHHGVRQWLVACYDWSARPYTQNLKKNHYTNIQTNYLTKFHLKLFCAKSRPFFGFRPFYVDNRARTFHQRYE